MEARAAKETESSSCFADGRAQLIWDRPLVVLPAAADMIERLMREMVVGWR